MGEKVAITANGPGLDEPMDPRFYRATWLLFVDTDSFDYEAVPVGNVENIAAEMNKRGVKTIISGRFGPYADEMKRLGFRLLSAPPGSFIRRTVEMYKEKILTEV